MRVTLKKNWTRKHDPSSAPARPDVDITCFDSLQDIFDLCAGPPELKLKAAGSHWALSDAALSDGEQLETNWPNDVDNVPRHSGFDIDLDHLYSEGLRLFLLNNPPQKPTAVIDDPCLGGSTAGAFYVHLKSGTRIYEAYQLLDQEGPATQGTFAARLNSELPVRSLGSFDGPWAFATLGGAGGQTVFGALTTGTHGGDYRQRPISDSVAAVHLVTDGGAHYWIEPHDQRSEFPIADDNKLKAHYLNLTTSFDPQTPLPFKIIRDSDVFDAVVVSAGRFGVIASFVLRVVPQYCLHEHRVLDIWTNVSGLLRGPSAHHVFDSVYFPENNRDVDPHYDKARSQKAFDDKYKFGIAPENRFLQIAINICPQQKTEHRCSVTQRWFVGHQAPNASTGSPSRPIEMNGRRERGTPATAGKSFPYNPDEPGNSTTGTFLQRACANGNFLVGALQEAANSVEAVTQDGFVVTTNPVFLALGLGPAGGFFGNPISDICLLLKLFVALVRALADDVESSGVQISLGQLMNGTIQTIVNDPDMPGEAKVEAVRLIFWVMFKQMEKAHDYEALSYAVMDTHDYRDLSCSGNAYSIEVFFDARLPDLYCSYVDSVLAFEKSQQETQGRFSGGYVSLRYVRGSRALIAPARFDETVVIEVAAIADLSGSVPLVNHAESLARHPQYSAPFHWGQVNRLDSNEVSRAFDGHPRAGALTIWRQALRDPDTFKGAPRFSSAFTIRAGLEP